MRHWSQIGTRNWRAKPGRTLLATGAVAIGVAVVVWVTGCFESVRRSITEVVLEWIGRSHVMVESLEGRWGLFNESLAGRVAALPEVAEVTVRTMELIEAAPGASGEAGASFSDVEITGIDPVRELLFRTHVIVAGRWLRPDDRGAVVAEAALARQWSVPVGGELQLRRAGSNDPPKAVTVVGLIERRRATPNQLPMLWTSIGDVQRLCQLPGRIKGLDIQLKDATPAGIRRGEEAVRRLAQQHQKEYPEALKVATTEAQRAKLAVAQGLLRFVLMLSASVLLLTALFIIAATMGMGVVERVTQIGLLRCVGVTRAQVAATVLVEALPVGAAGVAIGVPAGCALLWLTVRLAGNYLGSFMVSMPGLWLAVGGGLATALLGAALPALRALGVSPVEASRPLAHPMQRRRLAAAAVAGGALLAARHLIPAVAADSEATSFDAPAIASVALLYGGYALLAPLIVWSVGRIVLQGVARLLGLQPELLGDEIHKSPWRSAAVCCSLMVGLSMIVGLAVWARSVKSGWRFPREFPEALVYSWSPVPYERVPAARGVAGVKDLVAADEFHVSFRKPRTAKRSLLNALGDLMPTDKFSRFVAVDPRELPTALSLTYLEGRESEALAMLERGGSVLVTRELAQAQGRGVGDRITVYYNDEGFDFTIAGVIAAPALDIAVNFFNATEYFQIYSVGTVFGTREDAARLFNRRFAKLIVFNFDTAALSAQTTGGAGASGGPDVASQSPGARGRERPEAETPQSRNPLFDPDSSVRVTSDQEQAVVDQIKDRLGGPGPWAFATAAQLKRQIDDNLDRVTLLLSTAPLVGLLVAALGVGNLMMANVASRRRQLAVLRAVGATRGQVLRMVVGEALVLGVVGSGMGAALGVQLAQTSNAFAEALAGVRPELVIPWRLLGIAAATVCLLCAAAGLVPARIAARDNVVAALQST